MDIHNHRILILDFGSQYCQLIARRVRELGIFCEILPFDVDPDTIQSFLPNGIILSGGPDSVRMEISPVVPSIVFEMGCPVLGICYGMQTLVTQLGGHVEKAERSEFGLAHVTITGECPLLKDIVDEETAEGESQLEVWMSHGDEVAELPTGFEVVAATQNAQHAAVYDPKKRFYGLQFHPEVSHTRQGKRILERFIKEICGCKPLWTSANIIDDIVRNVRQLVGSDHVVLGLSGGVDSAVVASLLHKAIPGQIHCVFIDNGLLRHNEAKQVLSTFRDHMGIDIIHVNAQEQFLSQLKGVTDPEQKRKVIGSVFVESFEAHAKAFPDIKYLAQGTIYPDVIESAASKTGKADVIKSHHNVGGLPEKMKLALIEPLRELFKDEVRRIGLELGLPYEMVYRHPFPGPGLAVRIIGEVTAENLDTLRQADHIFIEALNYHDLYHKVSQAFAVFLPIKTVAVKGDARCYSPVIALRSVNSVDYMTADLSPLPLALLEEVASKIVNNVTGVSRVVYDLSSKPPATIEWE